MGVVYLLLSPSRRNWFLGGEDDVLVGFDVDF